MSGLTEITSEVTPTLEVWSDYVCPYCYLGYLTLKKLEAEENISLTTKAFELRPPGSPPTPPEVLERIKAMRPQFREMAKANYGLDINSGPFGVPSRKAHVGALFAEAQGKKEAYSERVYEAYWLEAKDISGREVLAHIAEDVGLEREAFLGALEDEALSERVLAEELEANELGLSGVPAAVIDRRYLVSGAQPYEVFKNALTQARGELSGQTCSANGEC